MSTINLYTIGFTKTNAELFFGRLIRAGVTRLIDIRLNNSSQLAGFAKKDDLRYFLRALGNIDYIHIPMLAPTEEILMAFKKSKGAWVDYEKAFLSLLIERNVENKLDRAAFDNGCLLCSEQSPEQCHRRLVAEYLKEKWGNIEIHHL